MRTVLLTTFISRHHPSFATAGQPVRPSFFLTPRSISTSPRLRARFETHQTFESNMSSSKPAPRRSARLLSNDATQENDEYNSMKVTELKDALRQNGLGVSGNKMELIHRLTAAKLQDSTQSLSSANQQPKKKRKTHRTVTPDADEDENIKSTQQISVASSSEQAHCLPRTREIQLQSLDDNLIIIGVDEAGRGPLAGPVVAAAAIVPTNISGVVDSKKITKEEERDELYEAIIASPGVRYAVAIVSAQRIDEINILQATLEGMRMATSAVMDMDKHGNVDSSGKNNIATAERTEISYVITGSNSVSATSSPQSNRYHALVDGNKVPKEMPCPAESMVKGDGREFAIAAASILAKVTRDRLMHEYDKKWPEYSLKKHKGYPTAAHMEVVKRIGASPIHRRTFAPLKYMDFDEDGKVISR